MKMKDLLKEEDYKNSNVPQNKRIENVLYNVLQRYLVPSKNEQAVSEIMTALKGHLK